MIEKGVFHCISEKKAVQPSPAMFLMSCSQVRTTLKTAHEKMAANPPRAFYTTKNIKCPVRYLPPFSRFCPRTLSQAIPQYSETQGIYVIICLSLRSNRQSLSRQQGIILIKTANAVTTLFSNIRTVGKKRIFSSKQGFLKVNPNKKETVNGMLQHTTGVLARLRHYHTLTIFVYFRGGCSC